MNKYRLRDDAAPKYIDNGGKPPVILTRRRLLERVAGAAVMSLVSPFFSLMTAGGAYANTPITPNSDLEVLFPNEFSVEDWVDVRQFGAVGNGKVDDTDALHRALSFASQKSKSRISSQSLNIVSSMRFWGTGVVVYLPPGNYLIRRTLVLPSGTTLQGHPAGASTLIMGAGVARHADHPFPILHAGPKPANSRAFFKPTDNLTASSKPPEGLEWSRIETDSAMAPIVIRDLNLNAATEKNPGGTGILWTPGPGFTIERVSIRASRYGVLIAGGTGPALIKNMYVEEANAAIFCSESASVRVSGLTGNCLTSIMLENAGPVQLSGVRHEGATSAVHSRNSILAIHAITATSNEPAAQAAIRCTESALLLSAMEVQGYNIAVSDNPTGACIAASPSDIARLSFYAGANSIGPWAGNTGIGPYGIPIDRINCGGKPLYGWSEDKLFAGGVATKITLPTVLCGCPLPGPVDLYTTCRQGPCVYELPCPTGRALLRLHFTEPIETASGRRTFSILVDGIVRRLNLDLFAEVGCLRALCLDFPINVEKDKVRVEIATGTFGNPIISGLELYTRQVSIPDAEDISAVLTLPCPSTQPVLAPVSARRVVNVRLAGATGDGDSDDWPVIESIITQSKGPVLLYLPPGIYRVSQALKLRPGDSIHGACESRCALIFDAPASGNMSALLEMDAAGQQASFSKFTVTVRPSDDSSRLPACAILVRNAVGGVMRNLYVARCYDAVRCDNCSDLSLDRLHLNSERTGLDLTDCAGIRLVDSFYESSSGNFIYAHGSGGLIHGQNIVSYSSGNLALVGGSAGVAMEGCAAISPSPNASTALVRESNQCQLMAQALQVTGFQVAVQEPITDGKVSVPIHGRLVATPLQIPGNPIGTLGLSLYCSPNLVWPILRMGAQP